MPDTTPPPPQNPPPPPVPEWTPEKIGILERLQKIFMPQAQRQREGAYKRQGKHGEPEPADLRIVHYTSAEAALNIIRSKRLWMRNTVCMADYREVQHGFDILNRLFSEPGKMESFIKTVDQCVPGAAKSAIHLFNHWWRDIRFNTFITSVSEHDNSEDFHGRLSMWRAFAPNTARVAIVFAVPKTSLAAFFLGILFNPVMYLPESAVRELIQEVLDSLAAHKDFLCSIDQQMVMGAIFDMLLVNVTCLKHEGFQEEREWRAVYCPKFSRSALMESATVVVGGVPQPIYRIPLDISASGLLKDLDFARVFNRLIIGPTVYAWPMFEAFREALVGAGVADAQERIWTSEIPIRP